MASKKEKIAKIGEVIAYCIVMGMIQWKGERSE